METAFEQLTKAVDEALEASEAALDIFNDIDFIQPALADLVKEVIPYLEEIKENLDEVGDAAEEDGLEEPEVWALQEEVLRDLYDEVDRADETFSLIDDIPDAATTLLGGDVPPEVEDGFYHFIEVRLEPMRKATSEVYRIIIEMASY